MPRGEGFWYDRRKSRWHLITEHATDAVTYPSKFRAGPVAHLNPTIDREEIVKYVAAQGFIRVRHWDRLGFEFHEDIPDALKALRRYIKSREIGTMFLVHIADFKSGWIWNGPVGGIPWQYASQGIGFQ